MPLAYAIVENGEINVRSVSPTRRGAILNFMCTERRFLATNDIEDVEIELCWRELKGKAEVEQVRIERMMQ
ncbi:hypothetical protein [Hyphomicrobium sp.]|uniref:hypothetical protein n=1 Tax=Hyphomicrobium sp. TaxID=82 RepID=UPI001DB34615|nr:hypothetical protein [Hyphomicrobium sp.]MBY0559903.1 hypothetical protein [Hyphomicrobium sp.]